MKFQGKIRKALPELKGTSQSGKEWRKVTYVLTYDVTKPEYPKEVVFDVMNDRIDELKLQEGHAYELEIDFNVREYQGKYYQSASCWRATSMEAPQPAVQVVQQPAPTPPIATNLPLGGGDEIPF